MTTLSFALILAVIIYGGVIDIGAGVKPWQRRS